MPDKGKNAHLAACDLALKINDLENIFNAKNEMFTPSWSTFQPTKKEANVETVNIIPGDDIFYMDCRILPQYTLKEVRSKVDERISEVEKKYGVNRGSARRISSNASRCTSRKNARFGNQTSSWF